MKMIDKNLKNEKKKIENSFNKRKFVRNEKF